jgi:hypothetical protein
MAERAETISQDAELTAVQQRDDLFERYHAGDLDGYQAYRNLLNLFWDGLSAQVAEPTAHYLMDGIFEMAHVASLDVDRTKTIYEEEQRKRYN